MFDTFQGAADIAGKLNAQLGMQLNSTEMMASSHEERLDILRAEFAMQGLNFKEMTKREKQMVAAILQTDVGTASRLFGDPMELRKMQRDQEAQEERLARFTTAVEKLQDAFEQMFIKIEPILNTLTRLIGGMAEAFGWLAESGILVGTIIVKAMGGFTKMGEALIKVQGGIGAVAKAMAKFSIIGGVFIALIEGFATGDWMYAIVQGATFTAGAIAGGILGTLAAPFLGPLAPLAPFMGSILGGILFQKLGAAMTGPADPNRFSRGSSLEPTMNDGFIQSSSQAGPMKIVKRDGTEEILNAADSALVFKPNGPFSDLFGQMGQQIRAAVTPQKSPAMPDFANRAGARLMAAAARPQAALSGGDSQGVNVSNELNLKVAMDGAPLRAKIVSEVQKMFQDGSNRTVDPGHWKLANA